MTPSATPVEVRGEDVFVSARPEPRDPRAVGLARLERGLTDNLRLVLAKAVLILLDVADPAKIIAHIARFGATRRAAGWGVGLTVLAGLGKVLPTLDSADDRARALVHAASRVAADCSGAAPRRLLPALSSSRRGEAGLTRWFREQVEVRDQDGAERILATLVEEHGAQAAVRALVHAATDHRYGDVGHALDYIVQAADLVELIGEAGGPDLVGHLLTSLVPILTGMQRMEETSPWRHPVDVAGLVEGAITRVEALADRFTDQHQAPSALPDEDAFIEVLLADAPAAALAELVDRLAAGAAPVALAEAVVQAAVARVVRFGTSNQHNDWNTVHHTLVYTSAAAEALRRVPGPEAFRAVLDGAALLWLDRFLNLPTARRPRPDLPDDADQEGVLRGYVSAFDQRGAVSAAATGAVSAAALGIPSGAVLARFAHVVLREDAGFHQLQQVEVAWRRLQRWGEGSATQEALLAGSRFCAAHFPTERAQEQTFKIARRLHRGDVLHVG